MVKNHDGGFQTHWTDEADWLVDIVMLPKNGSEEDSLDYVGKLFAFAFATDTRMLALVGDPNVPSYELWFSFNSDKHKEEFLQMVRDDAYADPDEENCFDPPVSLKDIADLRPIALVFPKDQCDHITAIAMQTMKSMGIEPSSLS